MDLLSRIKRLVIARRIRLANKARDEMEADGISITDVIESIANARRIDKVIRSRSGDRRTAREKLYVIKSFNFGGTLIYTKGAIDRKNGEEIYYILISAKIATFDR